MISISILNVDTIRANNTTISATIIIVLSGFANFMTNI